MVPRLDPVSRKFFKSQNNRSIATKMKRNPTPTRHIRSITFTTIYKAAGVREDLPSITTTHARHNLKGELTAFRPTRFGLFEFLAECAVSLG